MRVNILVLVAALGGCQTTVADTVNTAERYIGLQERQNRAEIKELVGVDPVRTEWCAAFVNAILEKDSIPGSESVSDNPLMARSFLNWGERVDSVDVRRGDIVVFPRGNEGWQGHVGFYVETDNDGRWIILGGNQDNTVSYAVYSPAQALGIRRYQINNTAQ